jgi:hypothetical protein
MTAELGPFRQRARELIVASDEPELDSTSAAFEKE